MKQFFWGEILMTIGRLLRQYRQEAGKTQRAWIGNIVSPSFYSKIEKDTTRISAQDLIEILRYNHVNLGTFFSKLDYQTKSEDELKKNVIAKSIEAYYRFDVDQLSAIKSAIAQSAVHNKEDLILKLNTLIYTASNSPEKLSLKERQQLKTKFYNEDNLDQASLKNFCNYMYFFDFTSNLTITKKIFKKFGKSIDEKIQFLVLGILINMIGICIKHQSFENAEKMIKMSKQVPTKPSTCFSKMVLFLLENLVNYHYEPLQVYLDNCEMQVKQFTLIGMEKFSQHCQKLIDENSN